MSATNQVVDLGRSDAAGRAHARPAVARSAEPGGRRSGNRTRTRLEIALFSGPAIAVYVVFVLAPVGYAAYLGFFKWNGYGPMDFLGIGNYTRALGDKDFLNAVLHNFFVIGLSLLIQGPIAIGVALLLNRPLRARGLIRALVFAPYIISEVVAGVAWLLLLQPEGPADAFLESLGVSHPPLWLADQNLQFWTVFAIISWKYIGFAIILFLAGLSGIPDEITEAAQIDGASWWQIQRHITIPLLGPTIRIWAFLSIIGSLQLFDMVYALTTPRPSAPTATMATYMIGVGIERSQFGYASAVAVILFVISFVIAVLYQRFVLSRDIADRETRAERRARRAIGA